MKNYFKKVIALLLAAVMVVAMGATVFAAGNVPSADDNATVTVKNVTSGTVTGYKIVKGVYDGTNGLKDFEAVEGVTIADISNPTEAEIAEIAKKIRNKEITLETVEFTKGASDYTANVKAGTYLVIVTGTEDATLYNPMLVSASYDKDSKIEGGTVDASGSYVLKGATVYAKSSTPTAKKTIVNADGKTSDGADVSHGADVYAGSTVNFQIESTIPDYSDAYDTDSLKFDVKDELDSTFTVDENSIKVYIDGSETALTKGNDTYTVECNGSNFTVKFASAYIKANGNAKVKVVYEATLGANAKYNFDPNENKVTVIYSNEPGTDASGSPKTNETTDITYHYTFGIDATLGGAKTNVSGKTTTEIIKTSDEKRTSQTATTENEPISGATFTLTSKDGLKTFTSTSDANGMLNFTGLDAGEYVLKETQAPDGYALEGKEHKVVISAYYNTDGTLASYSIKIDDAETSTYTATYTKTDNVVTGVTVTGDSNGTEIKNTKISNLPSTGGIGTYIFTIAGIAIMVAAVALFFANRRKKAE